MKLMISCMISFSVFIASTQKILLKVYLVADPKGHFAMPSSETEFLLPGETTIKTITSKIQKAGWYGRLAGELKENSEYIVRGFTQKEESRLLQDIKIQPAGYAQLFCYYKVRAQTD